jgi:hypothetical protein
MAQRLKRFIFCVWVILCVIGLGAVSLHSFDGVVPHAADHGRWPQDSRLVQESSERLVIFIHPQCPCTRATLSELEAVLARHTVATTLVVSAIDPEWLTSTVMQHINRIQTGYPALIDVFLDNDGSESECFEASASGHCMYFNRQGRKVFSGGITASRGHVGDNDARYRLMELIQLNSEVCTLETPSLFPVFGCRLPTKIEPLN